MPLRMELGPRWLIRPTEVDPMQTCPDAHPSQTDRGRDEMVAYPSMCAGRTDPKTKLLTDPKTYLQIGPKKDPLSIQIRKIERGADSTEVEPILCLTFQAGMSEREQATVQREEPPESGNRPGTAAFQRQQLSKDSGCQSMRASPHVQTYRCIKHHSDERIYQERHEAFPDGSTMRFDQARQVNRGRPGSL
jgi:hypothetical protein